MSLSPRGGGEVNKPKMQDIYWRLTLRPLGACGWSRQWWWWCRWRQWRQECRQQRRLLVGLKWVVSFLLRRLRDTERKNSEERILLPCCTIASSEFHVTAPGALMFFTCNICILMCFATGVCVIENSQRPCESAVFHCNQAKYVKQTKQFSFNGIWIK